MIDIASSTSILICPVCQKPLAAESKWFRCFEGHTFDRSREGYVNLHLKKKGVMGSVGDTREMLHSRRAFLLNGHFDFVSSVLCEGIQLIPGGGSLGQPLRVLDVGCGEGYHLERIRATFEANFGAGGGLIDGYGVDVSKDAVKMASRAYPLCLFVLANAQHFIPIHDQALDVVTVIFAPRNFPEFQRILKPGGLCMLVVPTPRHMQELRSIRPMLKIDEDKVDRILETARGFKSVGMRTLERSVELTEDDVQRAFMMTPNYWHGHKWGGEVRLAEHRIQVTFSMTFLTLSRS